MSPARDNDEKRRGNELMGEEEEILKIVIYQHRSTSL